MAQLYSRYRILLLFFHIRIGILKSTLLSSQGDTFGPCRHLLICYIIFYIEF